MSNFTESVVEDAALTWPESLGYAVKHLPAPQNDTTRQSGGPDKSPAGDTLTLTLPKGEGKLLGSGFGGSAPPGARATQSGIACRGNRSLGLKLAPC
jgi:hypothetical protein